jgi:hypothetical protein
MLPYEHLEYRILEFIAGSGELTWRPTDVPTLSTRVSADWNEVISALDRLHQQGLLEMRKWQDVRGWVSYGGVTTAEPFFLQGSGFELRMTSTARPYFERLQQNDRRHAPMSESIGARGKLKKCFVIMPIGKGEEQRRWREIYETIFKRTIETTGLDLQCERADDIHESGSIMRQVLVQLHSAPLVLADLTTQNPNVFYELGVRHAMGKRSILVGQSPQDSPFDTHQYRMLIYKYPADPADDFHLNVRAFLEDVIRNPKKPDNPVADLLPGLAEAADQVAIHALILELEDNLKAAGKFQIERTYVAPSNAEWLARRPLLNGLPEELRIEVASVYDKVRQWKAIVDSGINPLTGSMEIPRICQELKAKLPPLINRLKLLLEK